MTAKPITNALFRFGIVGACGRGLGFRQACDAIENLRVTVVCDTNQASLDDARRMLGTDHAYPNYEEMLDADALDGVLIATPMPLHAPQAIAALNRGIHVLSEVPAAVSIEHCRDLVAAVQKNAAIYMMGENCVFFRANQIVKAMVEAGLFGTLYYAEGQYLHELKTLNETTPWRRHWQTGINGITYGIHSLGPILSWMAGDRIVSVSCRGSGHHHHDSRGRAYENEDTCVMLAKTAAKALVNIRVDMLSDRPGSRNIYQLQGTDGCYESARTPDQNDHVWLRDHCPGVDAWLELEELAESHLPEHWGQYATHAPHVGHGGSELYLLDAFINSGTGNGPVAIGIHEAMDLTLPGLISQESILQEGAWIQVPDSRAW